MPNQYPYRYNTTQGTATQEDSRYETPGGAQQKVNAHVSLTTNIADRAVTQPKIADGAVGPNQLSPSLLQQYPDVAVVAKFEQVDEQFADTADQVVAIKTSASKSYLLADDFGAVGNGVTGDSAAIQAALDASNGQPVVLTSGKTYFLNTTIKYTSNTYLIGYGATLVGNGVLMDAANVTSYITGVIIEGVTFKTLTPGFNEGDRVLKVRACRQVEIKSCNFEGYNGDAIEIDILSSSALVPDNIQITGCVFDGLGWTNRNAITVFQGQNIFIRFCKFRNMGKVDMPGCIDIEPWNYNENMVMVNNVVIEYCDFDNIIGGAAINAYFDYGDMDLNYPPANFTFQNNTFRRLTKNFIFFEDRLHSSLELSYRASHNLKIINNDFEGSVTQNYFSMLVVSGTRDFLIDGNVFRNTGGAIYMGKTIDAYAFKLCFNGKITNNRFYKPLPQAAEPILFRIGDVENLTIADNIIISNYQGTSDGYVIFAGVAPGTYVKNNVIRDNVVYETGSHSLFTIFAYVKTSVVLSNNISPGMDTITF